MSAGDLEKTLASEEVQRRNITVLIEAIKEQKKALAEAITLIDTLQNNMMSQQNQILT